MSRLQQKIAVITGGNSGIGLATAKAWSAEGAKVIITGRNEETLASAASEIGEGTITVVGDLTALAHPYRSLFGEGRRRRQ